MVEIYPNVAAINALRETLDERLVESVRYLLTEVWQEHEQLSKINAAIERVLLMPAHPDCIVYGLSEELTNAALAEDFARLDKLAEHFVSLADNSHTYSHTIVHSFDSDKLGPDNYSLLRKLFLESVDQPPVISAPLVGEYLEAEIRIFRALSLMEDVAADWHFEFNQLVSKVFISNGDNDASAKFHGYTTFPAFGSVLIDAVNLKSNLAVMFSLVAQSSKMQLYLLELDSPFTHNDDRSLYRSPFHSAPVSMGGLFQTAWAAGRMFVLASQLNRDRKANLNLDELAKFREEFRLAFNQCYGQIEREALFTADGFAFIKQVKQETIDAC